MDWIWGQGEDESFYLTDRSGTREAAELVQECLEKGGCAHWMKAVEFVRKGLQEATLRLYQQQSTWMDSRETGQK